MKLCRGLGLFGTILSFGSLTSFFLRVSMDISFLDVSFNDIFQVMISPFGILFTWYSSFIWCWFLKVFSMHIYFMYFSLACFLSDPIYRETPPSLKLDEMCMKFIFISIC